VIDAVAVVLLVGGTAFLLLSAVGLLRLPDFYSRTHAVAKAETLGILLVVAGLLVLHRFGPGSIQLALVAVFAFMVNPVATHALSRAAARDRLPQWTEEDPAP
jgi:multicomponent Na+:H+ antiporter subunit G